MASEPALVLPAGALADTGGIVFPGFPGVWHPDQPLALSALGFVSAKDAERLVKELELPLKAAKAETVAADPAPEPETVAGLPDDGAGDG